MIANSDGKGGLQIDGIRYMLIRPDALMGIFTRLDDASRAVALQALAESVRDNGGKSAASYAGTGRQEAAKLISRIEATAPQLGWGVWQIALREDGLNLQVTGSPFAAAFEDANGPVCAAIRGMLGAITTQIFGAEAQVEETSCSAVSKTDICHFTARI